MTDLRTAAQHALEAMDELHRTGDTQVFDLCHQETTTEALRSALAAPEEDHELSAALGWPGGISEPVLDRKVLLRRVAELARDMQAKTKRLTDAEIGEVWFEAKIPGLTETQARLLIRAAERRLLEGKQ